MSEKKQTPPRAAGRRADPVRRRAPGPSHPQRRPLPRRRRAVRRRPREVGRARRGRRQPHRRPSSPSSPSAIRRPTIPGAEDLHQVGLRGARAQGAQAQLGQLLAHPPGARRASASTSITQTGPYLKAKVGRLDEPNSGDDEAEAPQHEPARHRQAGHPAHARAAARGRLAHRLHPGARRPGRPRRREPRRAGRREGAAPRDGRREGAHPQGAASSSRASSRSSRCASASTPRSRRRWARTSASTSSASSSRPSRRSSARTTATRATSTGSRSASRRRTSRPRPSRSRRSSSSACATCRSAAPSTRSSAPTSTGSSICPGTTQTPDNMDIGAVRKVLDEDHYGLEKVKKRILEYLAVRKLKKDKKGPILCLIGPPGVGKTSLGRSIARALGRKFVRISLGGVHDEAAIRGHRRTYVGALPGQIIQGMKKAGDHQPGLHARRGRQDRPRLPRRSRGGAARGARPGAEQHVRRPLPRDPVRPLERHVRRHGEHRRPDPARRSATAWRSSRSPATRGARSSRSRASTSSRSSSRSTASRKEQLDITDEAVDVVIDCYTREAGVRTLERQIASVIRGVAVKIAEGDTHAAQDRRRGRRCASSSAPQKLHERGRRAHRGGGRRDRPRLDERRRRDPLHRGDAHVRHGQAPAHRPARRRHEGVARRRRSRYVRTQRRDATASRRTSSRRATSTSTSRPAACRRTGRAPASRCSPRSSRCSPASASGTTWR